MRDVSFDQQMYVFQYKKLQIHKTYEIHNKLICNEFNVTKYSESLYNTNL